MKAERPTLVRDPHRPIYPFFHQHMEGPDRVVNLIESPLMRDGEVLPQAPGRLKAQDAVQLPVRGTGSMQIPLCQDRCRAGFSKSGGER